jgi:hypothetical protein
MGNGEAFPVRVTSFEEWMCEESVTTGLAPFTVSTVELTPSLRRFRNVVVSGRDWIPIQGNKAVLAVHTPEIYFKKQSIHPERSYSLTNGYKGIVAHLGVVRHIAGTSLLVGGSGNHYHWLVDHLPKWLLARRLLCSIPTVLVNEPTAPQRESLEMSGLTRWEVVKSEESVHCDDVWIVDGLARMTVAHPEIPRLFRQAYEPATRRRRAGIYLSRRDADSRRLVNEAEVQAVLGGFATYTASGMTFRDQVELFSSCECIVSPHGAGLANMIFSRPGTKIVEIYSELYKVTSMMLLAKVCGLTHAFVPARNVDYRGGNPLRGDWEVDIELLRDAVAQK